MAASISLFLLDGSGALPPSVTRTTSRSADHTKGLASGTKAGLVIDQPHARHGFDRGHSAEAAVFGEGIGRKRHVTAVDADAALRRGRYPSVRH